MKLKIKNLSENELPVYQTEGAAGMDIRSNEDVIVEKRSIVKTGLFFDIPEGYEIQVRARSGMAAKHGITLANGIGTIDSDYKKELGVILLNTTDESFKVSKGDRIAQIVLSKVEKAKLMEVEFIDQNDRDGFGSTGTK